MAELGEPEGEAADAGEGAAALERVQRRGREEEQAQGAVLAGYFPSNRGARFSMNARVPSR